MSCLLIIPQLLHSSRHFVPRNQCLETEKLFTANRKPMYRICINPSKSEAYLESFRHFCRKKKIGIKPRLPNLLTIYNFRDSFQNRIHSSNTGLPLIESSLMLRSQSIYKNTIFSQGWTRIWLKSRSHREETPNFTLVSCTNCSCKLNLTTHKTSFYSFKTVRTLRVSTGSFLCGRSRGQKASTIQVNQQYVTKIDHYFILF